jgi:hypothetical protein
MQEQFVSFEGSCNNELQKHQAYYSADASFFTEQHIFTIPELLHTLVAECKNISRGNSLDKEKHPERILLMRTRQNGTINCKEEGAKMAIQAEEDENSQSEFVNPRI